MMASNSSAPQENQQNRKMTLYIATSNPGKLRDFAAAATPNITLTPLPDLNQIPTPPEDEPTFEGNARLKALYYSRRAPGKNRHSRRLRPRS